MLRETAQNPDFERAGSERPAQPGQPNLNLDARAPKLIDLTWNFIRKSYALGDRPESRFPASWQREASPAGQLNLDLEARAPKLIDLIRNLIRKP